MCSPPALPQSRRHLRLPNRPANLLKIRVVVLRGRRLSKEFVQSVRAEFNNRHIKIGKFSWIDAQESSAVVSVGAGVAPGDYVLEMRVDKKTLEPQFPDVISVVKK